nr:hypothetical protein [Tessaracoccus coleopterorum]
MRALGAVDATGRVTAAGRRLADIPAAPRWARALLDAAPLVGGRAAAEAVAAVELGIRGDLARELSTLRRGGTPEARRWRREADRLGRLTPPGGAARPHRRGRRARASRAGREEGRQRVPVGLGHPRGRSG